MPLLGNRWPLVSVIIPCYNQGCYLAEAIESVLAQTYPNIEIIVVDDGSVDNTAEVASRYPVTVIAQRNLGVCRALNRGIGESRGSFYVVLNADDRLRPSYVEETLALLLANPDIGYVYTCCEYFGSKSGIVRSREFDLKALSLGNYINVSAIVRREAFDRVGGFDPEMRIALEDWDFFLSLAEAGIYGKLLPKPLLLYRRHATPSRNDISRRTELLIRWRIRLRHPRIFGWRYYVEFFKRNTLRLLPVTGQWH